MKAVNFNSNKESHRIEELITLSRVITLREFDEYIVKFLERKTDKIAGLAELDNLLASINNFSLNLSLYLKQNYLLSKREESTNEIQLYYTKKELAKKFRVDVRTITNWINDGLKTIEIGGAIRISQEALNEFIEKGRSKKFNWKSIKQVA